MYGLFELLAIVSTPNHIRVQITCYYLSSKLVFYRRIHNDKHQQYYLVFIQFADTSQSDSIRFDSECCLTQMHSMKFDHSHMICVRQEMLINAFLYRELFEELLYTIVTTLKIEYTWVYGSFTAFFIVP